MAKKMKQFDNEFKNNAVQYVKDHPELSQEQAAENLGCGKSTLAKWISISKQASDGKIATRGSGNYESDEVKEIARLKRELRDTKDALDILKKAISILGK